jgi:hypothetical protein
MRLPVGSSRRGWVATLLLSALPLAFAAPPVARAAPHQTCGGFVDIGASLIGVSLSSVAWGDYDTDGDLDILLTGLSDGGPIARVYRNDGGTFVDIAASLIGVYFSSVAWGDHDLDGDLDILLTGSDGSVNVTKVYRNDGGLFIDSGASLTKTTTATSTSCSRGSMTASRRSPRCIGTTAASSTSRPRCLV